MPGAQLWASSRALSGCWARVYRTRVRVIDYSKVIHIPSSAYSTGRVGLHFTCVMGTTGWNECLYPGTRRSPGPRGERGSVRGIHQGTHQGTHQGEHLVSLTSIPKLDYGVGHRSERGLGEESFRWERMPCLFKQTLDRLLRFESVISCTDFLPLSSHHQSYVGSYLM